MAELKAMVDDLGFTDVRTLLQSGNLVFRAPAGDDGDIERRLEAETLRRFEIATDYLVRTAPEWRAVIAANPFADMARDDPGHLLVMPLKAAASDVGCAKLQAAIKGREQVRVNDRCAYIAYPDGVGSSKLTIKIVERHLGAHGTMRNWYGAKAGGVGGGVSALFRLSLGSPRLWTAPTIRSGAVLARARNCSILSAWCWPGGGHHRGSLAVGGLLAFPKADTVKLVRA